jgi:hypothetical protein
LSTSSRELEILVAKIQESLAPDAEVIHNARLQGKSSKTKRQIDVLVRQRIGQYEMNIVLECKDHKRKVDVKRVDEFSGLLEDVGANKGALVCPKGFSEAAKQRAIDLEIDLYSPVDTDPHKWQVQVVAPCVCEFRSAVMQFGMSYSVPLPLSLPGDFFSKSPAYNGNWESLGTCVAAAVKKRNEGIFPSNPGYHNELSIFDAEKVFLKNEFGIFVPVSLTVSLHVERQLYYGNLPIEKISGFKDELSGNVITNAFTTGIFHPNIVVEQWRRFEDEKKLPIRPLLWLQGRVAWSDDVEVPLF